MRNLFLFALVITASNSSGQSSNAYNGQAAYSQPNPYIKDRTDYTDQNGQPAGYAERNPFIKDKVDYYDQNGKSAGYSQHNPYIKDRTDYYQNSSNKNNAYQGQRLQQ